MKASDLNKYDLVKNTLVLILAGGRGSRLHELTDKRAKPALYFGGNRRIIDFALSNCINSGLTLSTSPFTNGLVFLTARAWRICGYAACPSTNR